MKDDILSLSDGILHVLEFLYLTATPSEIKELINSLAYLSIQEKSFIEKEILSIQKFFRNHKVNNQNLAIYPQEMRQPMEMEIMVGGNEIHQNAIDLGFELFIHWSQYRRNFHREIDNEANDIDIFQYWLLLWMKIIDAIHDFMSHRADAEHTEKKKSVNHFMEKMMSKTGIKFERNTEPLRQDQIIHYLFRLEETSSHKKITNWEKQQFVSQQTEKVLQTLKSNMEDDFIQAIPVLLMMEIKYSDLDDIEEDPALKLDLIEDMRKRIIDEVEYESKKDFIQLFKRYCEFINPTEGSTKTNQTVHFIDILDYQDSRVNFYTILKMQQLIYHTTQNNSQEIPITIDATHRVALLDKYFLPYTFMTHGFQIVIQLFLGCRESVGRELRRILYQSLLLIFTDTMSLEEKKTFYQQTLIPQIQQLDISKCETSDLKQIDGIQRIFPNIIQKIMFLGGVIEEDIDKIQDRAVRMRIHADFSSMTNEEQLKSQEDLQWAVRKLNQPHLRLPQQDLITRTRKKIEQMSSSIRSRSSPHKNFGKKKQNEFMESLRKIYDDFDYLYSTHIENLETQIELKKMFMLSSQNQNEIDDLIKEKNMNIKKKDIYLNQINQFMIRIQETHLSGTSEIDKQSFEIAFDKIMDEFAVIFAGDYLYTDYQTIFWKNHLIHYHSDASLWDASTQKDGIHTNALTIKYKSRCNKTPTTNVFGIFQQKLYSDYFMELGGISSKDCNTIDRVQYKGTDNFSMENFRPEKFHSVSFLSEIIRYKISIEKLEESQKQVIYQYLKNIFMTKNTQEDSYLAFLVSVPIGTLFALKRSGDWSQVEHCYKTNTFFASFDKLALFYAYYRGIGTFCFKDNKFITTKISKNYQNELIQSLDNIGTIFTKIL